MTYLGHVINGVVVFDGHVELPEGAIVKIELLSDAEICEDAANARSIDERLSPRTEAAAGLPPDAVLGVDRYLRKVREEETEFGRLLKQFVIGLLFLAFISWVFCEKNLWGFFGTFALLICAVAIVAGLTLTWLARWAMRKNSRFGQFGISTMLLMLFFAGLYCGIIRWLTLQSPWSNTGNGDDILVFVSTAVVFTILSIAAIPFVIGITESLLWFAVWLQKRHAIRRLLLRFGRRRE